MAGEFKRQPFLTPRVAQGGDLASLSLRLNAITNVASSAASFAGRLDVRSRQNQQAAVKAYQGSASNDILEGVERIQAESFSEVEFNKKVGEFRNGMFTDVPPEFQDQFTQIFDNIETRSRIEIQGADIERTNQENKVLAQQGLTGFRKQAAKAAFNGDLDTLEFSRDNFIDLLDNPRFTPSEVADSMLELDKELDEQQVLGAVDSLYTEDPKMAFVAISSFSNNKDLDIDPDEQKRITALAYQGVMNRTKISEQIEKIEDDDNEARIKANEEDLSTRAYGGELTEVEFLQSLRDRKIDAEAADRIRKRMNNVTAVKDNPNVLLDIERQFPDLSTGELEVLIDNAVIDGNMTSSTASRLQRNVIARDQKTEDEEVKNTRNLLKGFLKEQNDFTAIFDSNAERRFAAGMAQFNERVTAGEEPNAVYLDVLNQSSEQNELILRTLPPLKFGTAENLDDSKLQVTNAFQAGTLNREEANRQLELIKTMQGLKLRFTKK